MIDEIVQAIVREPGSGLVKEQAGELVQGWITRFGPLDHRLNIAGVEQPWFEWLSNSTLAVGVRDLILDNGYGEWKTHRPARVRRDGQFYEGEGPEAWTQQMHDSIQLALYAPTDTQTEFLCRAAVKTSPPSYWESVITIAPDRAQLARHSLLVQADAIRGMRKHAGPWRFPDKHRVYNRACVCATEPNPTPSVLLSPSDPGAAAIKDALAAQPERDNSDLVVLSASAYETGVSCMEAYRRSLTDISEEENEALQLGSCFHAGIAAYYRSMIQSKEQENQSNGSI